MDKVEKCGLYEIVSEHIALRRDICKAKSGDNNIRIYIMCVARVTPLRPLAENSLYIVKMNMDLSLMIRIACLGLAVDDPQPLYFHYFYHTRYRCCKSNTIRHFNKYNRNAADVGQHIRRRTPTLSATTVLR